MWQLAKTQYAVAPFLTGFQLCSLCSAKPSFQACTTLRTHKHAAMYNNNSLDLSLNKLVVLLLQYCFSECMHTGCVYMCLCLCLSTVCMMLLRKTLNLITPRQRHDCLKTVCFLCLHSFEDLIRVLANRKKHTVEERSRERKESSSRKRTRRQQMMAKAFVIPPTDLPTVTPPFLALLHFTPYLLLARTRGPRLLSLLWPGLLETAVVAPSASGNWRLLQTIKLPIWRGISGKGHYEPFLTHLDNAEVNQVAEGRTSILHKLQNWVELCCFLMLYM